MLHIEGSTDTIGMPQVRLCQDGLQKMHGGGGLVLPLRGFKTAPENGQETLKVALSWHYNKQAISMQEATISHGL